MIRLALLVTLCIIDQASAGAERVHAEPQQDIAEVQLQRDGYGYAVSRLEFSYPFSHPDLPSTAQLGTIAVLLTPVADGWIGPVEGAPVSLVRLDSIGVGGPTTVYGSALASINQGVRDALELEYGLIGHLVTPDASEVAYQTSRLDLRQPGDTALSVLVWRAAIGEVRTVAAGDRIAEDVSAGDQSNVNHPSHRRTRDRIQLAPGDLLTRHSLEEEIARVNRHPGRQVEAAIAPGERQGEVVVDLLINEPRQWTAYAQTSNTGTDSTDEWQERFGFVHNQLTGRDDILRLDYITAGFDESHAVLGSYSFDLGPRARATISGRWNEYTASDVGFGFENFVGEGFEIGAEIAVNVHQNGDAFLDLFGGIRHENISVENRVFLIEGDEDFLLPYLGARWERVTPLKSTFFEVLVEGNLANAAGTDSIGVQRLGRFGVDDEFAVLRGAWSHSRFLEPIFDPGGFRGDRGADAMTLAHELAVSVRAQHALGYRLVPNFQQVAGGFASVRGYNESEIVGDDAIIASAEYRYHFGRGGSIAPDPVTLFGRPFRSRRTRPYGGADWDLIIKGFVDAASVSSNDAPFFERDETMIGVGVGLEARLRRNLTLRLDYGIALSDIGPAGAPTTDSGDSRLHFSATILF